MADLSCSGGVKRKLAAGVSAAQPRSSKVTFLSHSFLFVEIPADADTSLPVWEALRSRQVDMSWTVNPYSISIHVTPVTSKQGNASASSINETTSSSTFSPGVQYVPQQHNVLLPFSQNSSLLPCPFSHHHETPADPNPATAIVAQTQPDHQSSTPTKNEVPSAILTPTCSPTVLQTPSTAPVPVAFHTKISPDVEICDSFLLGICQAGTRCKMHHTRYPFHWQLWSVVTHQWVDVSPRSQVLLERLYCNLFCHPSLDGPYKYDSIRRLTNADSPARNPYYPSKWKIYWWNNLGWEEYKLPECFFHIGSERYKVDFTAMLQTNIRTGFQRDVRYRPVYRSPDHMQPHLQTGIQSDSTQPIRDPPDANFNVDPLEEFSSWYPPVWRQASEQDCSIVDVPAGTRAYKSIQNLFYESMSETAVDVIGIQQVQNVLHWDKYQRQKAHMQKHHTNSEEPLERHLFHGTTSEASEGICYNNFDPRMAGVNGTAYGFGSYFATTAVLANPYSNTEEADEVQHMFLAKVLVGKVTLGSSSYHRPPPCSSKTKQYHLYDACVDKWHDPTMFVVFDSCQCYPYYLIKYKDLPREIYI
uniref:TCDD-inducible poly [ADP-ribose] polymerase-like n=1 Tax=Stegastes partitus TaxID=144197 RepID=A0A3B4ZTK8_9TELE